MSYRVHGYSLTGRRSGEYSSWQNMVDRCTNPKNPYYHNYGGRGIKVCSEWLSSFVNFINDVGNKPTNDSTLGRIDNEKDYCKDNCRWETRAKQMVNSRPALNNPSGRVGVIFDKSRDKWIARIGVNGKSFNLGRFSSIADATKAREKAELHYYGEILV